MISLEAIRRFEEDGNIKKLEYIILPELVEIKSIQCMCVGCQQKIDIRADFEITANNTMNGNIYTYFSCPRHGSIQAKVNGVMFSKPSELFEYTKVDGHN